MTANPAEAFIPPLDVAPTPGEDSEFATVIQLDSRRPTAVEQTFSIDPDAPELQIGESDLARFTITPFAQIPVRSSDPQTAALERAVHYYGECFENLLPSSGSRKGTGWMNGNAKIMKAQLEVTQKSLREARAETLIGRVATVYTTAELEASEQTSLF
jgi:hypothetical protein